MRPTLKRIVLWFSSSLWRVMLLYVVSVAMCTMTIAAVEGKTEGDALWYVLVTALTIGYGDMTAITTEGRTIIMVYAHLWILFIAPLVVVNILHLVTEDRNEFSHEEQEEIKRKLDQLLEKVNQNVEK